MIPPPPFAGYNSLWQFRMDGWCSLEEECLRLAAAVADPERTSARAERVELRASSVRDLLQRLEPVERYWAFPGRRAFQHVTAMFSDGRYDGLARVVTAINTALVDDTYRTGAARAALTGLTETAMLAGTAPSEDRLSSDDRVTPERRPADDPAGRRPYFELLVVEELTEAEEEHLRADMRRWRRADDQFTYELVIVPSLEDAAIAAALNFNLQACVVRRRFGFRSPDDVSNLSFFAESLAGMAADDTQDERAGNLARLLARARPELDLYLMTEGSLEQTAAQISHHFRRVFHAREGLLELHLTVLAGVDHRYKTPFFQALKKYSRRPTGVFHALPISHGKSIINSHWVQDMVDFYGLDIFLAETSATCGGLDSLLDPTGPLREAQRLAAETFGARQTYFVTNGTSTANKIVVQALVCPGDIVLVDRNCHQSHHYGLMMAGAEVIYLDAYPLSEYSMYGAVSLRDIKKQLLDLRRAGKLDRVKMLMLTNCTFDGIVYDPIRVMEECLAIKPDLVFLWDEAWFAFARFHPIYRPRTGMRAARSLLERLRDPDHAIAWAEAANRLREDAPSDDELLDMRLSPDPAVARVRVYATQSTHKTLTSLRQGSMIHVLDQDFGQKVEETFREAYMAHTSTSPNYQILASLDLGRRQAAIEGFELVQKQVECAMRLRDAVDTHPLLQKYMRCLTTADLIPSDYRPAGIDQPLRSGLPNMMRAWREDEFVLDPTRITISIGATGIDGDTFKRVKLMDEFGVQINKTTRNTVLFMTNIGTSRSSVGYLIEVLVKIARDLDDRLRDMSTMERVAHEAAVYRLTNQGAPLPDFSRFHDAFRSPGEPATSEGDVRRAFYLSYDEANCEFLTVPEIEEKMETGSEVVSATYVTPYPPGFPVLVPGQVFTRQILDYMVGLDTSEVHGYRPEIGFRVYVDKALETFQAAEGASP